MAGVRLEMVDRQPENGFVSREASTGSLSRVDGSVLPFLGGFGKYQRRLVVLTWIPALFIGFSQFSDYFLLAQPKITCVQPIANASNLTGSSASPGGWPSADIFANGTGHHNGSDVCLCEKFRYELESGLVQNVVTKWDLVCDSAWKVHIAKFSLLVGSIFGYLVMGILADWFGRHPVLLVSVLFMLAFGLPVAFSVDVTMFSTLRFFEGFCLAGITLSLYVLRIELCLPRYRFSMTMVASFVVLGGQLLMPGLAALCKDWQFLQMVIVCPLILMLLYAWLFPESLRWLLATQQYARSKGLMSQMAKKNEVDMGAGDIDILAELQRSLPNKPKKTCIVKMVGTRNLWKNIVVLCVNSLTGYGIHHCFARSMRDPESTETPLFQSFYMDYYTMAGIALAACVALCPVVSMLGRRGGLLVFMIFTALASLLQLGLLNLLGKYSLHLNIERSDTLNRNFSIAFSIIGMFSSHAVSNLSIFFCAEVTPTAIRGGGLGLVLASAGFGMLTAPIMELHNQKGYFLHHIIFACCTLLCIICILLLPEPQSQPLPEAIADGENYARQPLLLPRRAGEQRHLLSRSQSRDYTPLHQITVPATTTEAPATDSVTPPTTDSRVPPAVTTPVPLDTQPAAPLVTDSTAVLAVASIVPPTRGSNSSPDADSPAPLAADTTAPLLTTDSIVTPPSGPVLTPPTDYGEPVLLNPSGPPGTNSGVSPTGAVAPPATDSITPGDAMSPAITDSVESPNIDHPSLLPDTGSITPLAKGSGSPSPTKDSATLASDSVTLFNKDSAFSAPAKECMTHPDNDSASALLANDSSSRSPATDCPVAPATDFISPLVKDSAELPVKDITTKETGSTNGMRSS